jgi:hypothetical protein
MTSVGSCLSVSNSCSGCEELTNLLHQGMEFPKSCAKARKHMLLLFLGHLCVSLLSILAVVTEHDGGLTTDHRDSSLWLRCATFASKLIVQHDSTLAACVPHVGSTCTACPGVAKADTPIAAAVMLADTRARVQATLRVFQFCELLTRYQTFNASSNAFLQHRSCDHTLKRR